MSQLCTQLVLHTAVCVRTCNGAYLAALQCSWPRLICCSPVRLRLPLQAATMLPGVTLQG